MMSTRTVRMMKSRLKTDGRAAHLMMNSIHHAATRLVMLLGLALLACTSTGCQCCAWYERYMDCVDHVCDHEGNAQVLYRPWYDLNRIGRVNWPWRCGRKSPPPGFVYDTPVTHRVLSRVHDPQQQLYSEPASPAPPPLLPEDIWSQPSDRPLEGDEVGVAPLGPLFESEVPPSPEPIEAAPPAPGLENFESLPQPEARRQPAQPREESVEARQPTPAPPRLPVSSEIDALNSSRRDWMDDSGVVRLFDESKPSTGFTMHRVDHDEHSPIRLDTWLSGQESVDSTAETASAEIGVPPATAASPTSQTSPWASASVPATEDDSNPMVTPSAGWADDSAAQTTEPAHWWDEPAPSRSGRSTVPASSSTGRTTDDVFGAAPFAEWQSVTE